jgi:hypothetical protein
MWVGDLITSVKRLVILRMEMDLQRWLLDRLSLSPRDLFMDCFTHVSTVVTYLVNQPFINERSQIPKNISIFGLYKNGSLADANLHDHV